MHCVLRGDYEGIIWHPHVCCWGWWVGTQQPRKDATQSRGWLPCLLGRIRGWWTPGGQSFTARALLPWTPIVVMSQHLDFAEYQSSIHQHSVKAEWTLFMSGHPVLWFCNLVWFFLPWTWSTMIQPFSPPTIESSCKLEFFVIPRRSEVPQSIYAPLVIGTPPFEQHSSSSGTLIIVEYWDFDTPCLLWQQHIQKIVAWISNHIDEYWQDSISPICITNPSHKQCQKEHK